MCQNINEQCTGSLLASQGRTSSESGRENESRDWGGALQGAGHSMQMNVEK